MAPEQVLAEDVDGRADVYALGILTYAVVAGRVPFDGSSFTAIAQQHLSRASINPGVIPAAPDSLDAAIRRATAKRKEDRFDTVAAFYAELQRAAAESPDMPVGARARAAAPAAATAAGGAGLDATMVDSSGGGMAALIANEEGVECPTCHSTVRPGVRFCTACGGRMPDLTATATAGDGAAPPPLVSPAAPAAAAAPSVHAPRHRRHASAFTRGQWITIGLAAVAVLFVNVVGLWLTLEGRSAGEDTFLSGLLTYILDELPWFKSWMTLIALVLAGWRHDMWLVVMDQKQRTPETYRRLRQYHRLMGYAAAVTAFSIGLLTCVGIFGFDFSTTRRAIHTVMGTSLLLAIVAKIAVVRFVPRYRRYLEYVGFTVLAFYGLTFLTSAVPWVWDQITGAAGGKSTAAERESTRLALPPSEQPVIVGMMTDPVPNDHVAAPSTDCLVEQADPDRETGSLGRTRLNRRLGW
jgi:hypothetical protein